MKIGITLDGVIRDFSSQFLYVYNKYIEPYDIEKEGGLKTLNLVDDFNFKDKLDLNNFLYNEASLEIFGHADQTIDGVMTYVNKFIILMEEEELGEVVLINREANKSKSATLFFLSKLGFTGDKIIFVKNYGDEWDHVDSLITANPITLANKPKGKVSHKIETLYNVEQKADSSHKNFIDLYNSFVKTFNIYD